MESDRATDLAGFGSIVVVVVVERRWLVRVVGTIAAADAVGIVRHRLINWVDSIVGCFV